MFIKLLALLAFLGALILVMIGIMHYIRYSIDRSYVDSPADGLSNNCRRVNVDRT